MRHALKQDILLKIHSAFRAVDMLYAGALFQSQLRLAVGTAQVAVGLEVPHLHILALEKIRYRRIDVDEAVVLIQSLVDIGGQRAEHRQRPQHQYQDNKDRTADKEVDEVDHRRNDPDKGIQFVVSVAALHELSRFLYEITQSTHPLRKADISIASLPLIVTYRSVIFKKIIPLRY